MANQFVVQLKNEPGAMATLAEALAARGVDLRAIGGGGIGDAGHVIMTTADDDTTKARTIKTASRSKPCTISRRRAARGSSRCRSGLFRFVVMSMTER